MACCLKRKYWQSGVIPLYFTVMIETYLQTFSTRMRVRDRRQALLNADADIAVAETIPLIFLLVILLLLPIFFGAAPFSSFNNFLWWMKAWMPIVVAVTAVLYFPVGFQIAPTQLTGAVVGAMTASPDSDVPLALPVKAESVCTFALSLPIDEDAVTARWKRTYHQQICRRQSGRQRTPFYRFIPHPDSRDTSA